jgi:hypothetical protein
MKNCGVGIKISTGWGKKELDKLPRGIPKRYMKARKKSFSVFMRPFIREIIEKKMPVEKGLAYLEKKKKEYHEMYD